ncbi:IS66 family transposase [Ruminococcus sp.]|uniref:IS66 family transposase n=1 Tax=Ruminococcus sp. TaxID=41978 RepID=UPI0025D663E5|nr:IS66 family transposase [Ruminococcus sp.]MBQ8967187.1 IS66 family transposase [Ruminococcus sp.]
MYENLSRFELESRLNFFEEHNRYMSLELTKANEKIEALTDLGKELKAELDRVNELLKLAKDALFGRKTEKTVIIPDGQLCMFDVAGSEIVAEQPKRLVKTHYRSSKRTFEEKYGDLPSEEEFFYLSDDEKICRRCGADMHIMGFDSFTEIEHIPAVFKVRRIFKQKCVCKCCEQEMDKNGEERPVFVKANGPFALIRGSMVSPSLAANEINSKICLRLPLYCMEQEYSRNGIYRSRQTMCNNMLSLAEKLEPLYDLMIQELMTLDIIHADETPWQVNHRKDKAGITKGYFWVYVSGRYEPRRIAVYDYQNGRGAEYPKRFLAGFSGYGHCDGYSGYENIPGFKRVGCFSHLRRYFLNAVKVQSDKQDLTTVAGQGFLMINEIFHAEKLDPEKPHEGSTLSLEETAKIREKVTEPLLEKFFSWCARKSEESLPSEKTREAIRYALNQKASLMRVLKDPRLELTNNRAERAVRPVAVGRKNWLFSNSERGARALSILFSIVETAKANSLKVYDYLKFIFDSLRSGKSFEWEELLPWSKTIPDHIRL